MATIYCRSTDGNDSDDGSTWALAKATLQAAVTAAGAGGTVYVSQAHNENYAASQTLTLPVAVADYVTILCVNDSEAPPTALATGAVFSTTGNYYVYINGCAYIYGMTFVSGIGTVGSSGALDSNNVTTSWWLVFDTCILDQRSTNSVLSIQFGSGGTSSRDAYCEFINTRVGFANIGQSLGFPKTKFVWRNTPNPFYNLVPTYLLSAPATGGSLNAILKGLDLSAMTSGKYITEVMQDRTSQVYVENCKLGSAEIVENGSIPGPGGMDITVVNSSSDAVNYAFYRRNYAGTITHETTVVRTGGATDGTTPISRKMVTTANAMFAFPLALDSLVTWNEVTGVSRTATVEIITDGVTLTDKEAWIEVEYLGSAGYPLALTAMDRAIGILSNAVNQTASTVSWSNGTLTSPVKQKLSVSFTPQMKGLVRATVKLAKPSTTMYVCPKLELT